MRFLHVADIHLGYQQYGCAERFNDFSKAFFSLTDLAVERKVDFFLLAGDLFEKRTVDPLAMRVAIEGLSTLRDAGIPVLAVEGNHERAHYRDEYSWVDFLNALGYLRLLNPRFEQGRALLEPHGEDGGAYVDLPGGVRVYGLKYYGASTGKVFSSFAEAVAEMDHQEVHFAILIAHAGLEGQLDQYSGTLTHHDLAPLKGQIDYVGLGHIHKPYEAEGWIYNPGSAETWNVQETEWPERGCYLVEIEEGDRPGHRAELIAPPRRSFCRFRLPVDAFDAPQAVYDALRSLLRRKRKEIACKPAPVIELTLTGVLAFNRFDLDLDYVEQILREAEPLLARVRNATTPAEFEVPLDVEASRPELERSIVHELLERDARYRRAAEDWTRVALDVKRMALERSSPEALIDYLRRARAELVAPGEEA